MEFAASSPAAKSIISEGLSLSLSLTHKLTTMEAEMDDISAVVTDAIAATIYLLRLNRADFTALPVYLPRQEDVRVARPIEAVLDDIAEAVISNNQCRNSLSQ